jgi:hypothetical protein
MVYQKREELEADWRSYTTSTRENCLQSPMLKKDTSGATISSTPLPIGQLGPIGGLLIDIACFEFHFENVNA